MTPLLRDVQRQIHRIREQAGLSQSAAARRLETSQQWVNKLENDTSFNPSLATLETVAKAFGMSLEIKFRATKSKRRT